MLTNTKRSFFFTPIAPENETEKNHAGENVEIENMKNEVSPPVILTETTKLVDRPMQNVQVEIARQQECLPPWPVFHRRKK